MWSLPVAVVQAGVRSKHSDWHEQHPYPKLKLIDTSYLKVSFYAQLNAHLLVVDPVFFNCRYGIESQENKVLPYSERVMRSATDKNGM